MSTAFAIKPAATPNSVPANWLDLEVETATEAPQRVSEAMFIASALAGWGDWLRGELSSQCVNNVLFSVLRDHTHAEVISWHERVAKPEWRARWRWAAATTQRLYADLLDVRDVALELDELPDFTGR